MEVRPGATPGELLVVDGDRRARVYATVSGGTAWVFHDGVVYEIGTDAPARSRDTRRAAPEDGRDAHRHAEDRHDAECRDCTGGRVDSNHLSEGACRGRNAIRGARSSEAAGAWAESTGHRRCPRARSRKRAAHLQHPSGSGKGNECRPRVALHQHQHRRSRRSAAASGGAAQLAHHADGGTSPEPWLSGVRSSSRSSTIASKSPEMHRRSQQDYWADVVPAMSSANRRAALAHHGGPRELPGKVLASRNADEHGGGHAGARSGMST